MGVAYGAQPAAAAAAASVVNGLPPVPTAADARVDIYLARLKQCIRCIGLDTLIAAGCLPGDRASHDHDPLFRLSELNDASDRFYQEWEGVDATEVASETSSVGGSSISS